MILPEKENFRKSLDLEDFIPEARIIIEDYRCPLCEGIYLNPVVDVCGHVYCKQCIFKHLEKEKACPISKGPLTEELVKTLMIVNDILHKQLVQCKNRLFKCEWVGKLQELEEHLNITCTRQVVVCTNIGCGDQVFREDLPSHLQSCNFRIVPCPDCELQVAFNSIKLHQEQCPKFKLVCPQNCGQSIERKDILQHISNECENTVISCPYADYGCNTQLTKRQLNDYLTTQMNRHNLLILSWLKEFQMNAFNRFMQMETNIEQFDEQLKKMETLLLIKVKGGHEIDKENSESKKLKKNCSPLVNNNEVINQQNISMVNASPEREQEKDKEKEKEKEKFISRKRMRLEEDAKLEKIDLTDAPQLNIVEKDNQASDPSSNVVFTMNNANDGTKKKESLFDLGNLPKGIVINYSRVMCQINPKTEHKFVFANISTGAKELEWRTIINATSTWVGLGLCIKEQVLLNKQKFVSSNPNFNHGTFGISINGYSWNANLSTENNSYIKGFPSIVKGDMIVFRYFPELKELSYKIVNKFSGKLTNVYANKDSSLTPCILFLNPGDEVLLEFNN